MLGAQVHQVPVVPYSNPNQYQKVAQRLAASLPNAIWSNQFDNTANRDTTRAPRALRSGLRPTAASMPSSAATGTGGTFAGVAEYLKSRRPTVRCVLADPSGQQPVPLRAQWNAQSHRQRIDHRGHRHRADHRQTSRALRSMTPCTSRIPTRCATSTGCCTRGTVSRQHPAASTSPRRCAWRRGSGPGHTVVTVLCDSGANYQSRLFNVNGLNTRVLAANAPRPPAGAPVALRAALVA